MPTQRLTNEIITAAIEGFEAQKQRIDEQIAGLRSILTGCVTETAATPEGTPRKRGKFSDATRLRMREAQQLRWARIKGTNAPSTAVTVPAKAKRQMSEAGRKAIGEATRKRWAAVKAAKENGAAPATKKANRKKAIVKKTAKVTSA